MSFEKNYLKTEKKQFQKVVLETLQKFDKQVFMRYKNEFRKYISFEGRLLGDKIEF